jgi:hypothetical protein
LCPVTSAEATGDEQRFARDPRQSDEAKKTAAGATSDGQPTRPSGVFDTACFSKSLPTIPAARSPSVSTTPRLMALTRILRGPSSLASALVTVSPAPLVAL